MKYLVFSREQHIATGNGYRTGDGWGSLQDATRFEEPPEDGRANPCRIIPVIDLHTLVERAVYVPAFACSDCGYAPLAARIAVTHPLAQRINALFVTMAENGIDECTCYDGVDWVHADDMQLDSDAMRVFADGSVFWRAIDAIDDTIETRVVPLEALFCSTQTVLENDDWCTDLRAQLIAHEYIAANAT